jgi:cytidine diphosphoramidate kinase
LVIWITGLAGAGKTSLCNAILSKRTRKGAPLVRLDGDEAREVFGQDLGYKVQDRIKHFGRMQRLAKMLSDQGQLVLVGVLYSNPELLAWNRKNIEDYYEVYLNVDFETLRQRDQKKLYSRALAGEVKDVVGIDIPWTPPVAPDFVVEGKEGKSPDYWASILIDRIPELRKALFE